ncbi:YkgJ family cysteine cluster protein [Acidobacteria bacterium ACD]|nr:MAG: YkgJ family cysteine cluster protein [Acidobacteriota bacterium]MDL1948351.1 YkgJ family cysteine cluster protein [Acidobacteria bacterium ACD]
MAWMEPTEQGPQAFAHLSATLSISGEKVPLEISVPAGPVPRTAILPALGVLADSVAGAATHQAAARGETVSCRAGCGACCRQLVPIAPTEARALAALVEALPLERRDAVTRRFDEIRARLAAAGLLEELSAPERVDEEGRRRMAPAYFALKEPCPFLVEESCSIHAERPLSCREYLVTSPAEACGSAVPGSVKKLRLAGSVWAALARAEAPRGATRATWVPLSLALSWAASHPAEEEPRPGTTLFEDVVRSLLREPG